MFPQRGFQFGHRSAHIRRGRIGRAQGRQQFDFKRRQIDSGDDAIAHDVAAGDDQAFDVLLLRLGQKQIEGGHIGLDQFGRQFLPVKNQQVRRRGLA